MIVEHSLVVLKRDRAPERLSSGDVGAVVHVYDDGGAYEVEFIDGGGTTVALLSLTADEVRLVEPGELLHARRIA